VLTSSSFRSTRAVVSRTVRDLTASASVTARRVAVNPQLEFLLRLRQAEL
jgi:hypothetical protein